MPTHTLYWHDYETFGADPHRDRPVQFAGVRTDQDFNVLEEPLCIFCKPPDDYLPDPDACLITGITPQMALEKGLCEADFIKQIHNQLVRSNTCALGYNSLRFDDEVTRNTLYRNFYDPYAREWQNGNSRWDLIDVVRTARALRPEGIEWPFSDDGKPTFRLEELTKANDIQQEGAHDALVDVMATIALAKRVKQAQPKLYDFLWQHRGKNAVQTLLAVGSFVPVVHISGMYPVIKHCLAVVLPLCKHPTDSNGVIVYDLSVDPEPLLTLTSEAIKARIFTATADLPDGVERIPLKTVHVNRCPVLAPLNVIRAKDAERLEIDLMNCKVHLNKIKQSKTLLPKLEEVFGNSLPLQQAVDPDLAIYSGGFFADTDKKLMSKIHALAPELLGTTQFQFKDKRVPEMLFRYRARNYPDTLTQEEKLQWQTHCRLQLMQRRSGSESSVERYYARLQMLREQEHPKLTIIKALQDYLDQIEQAWSGNAENLERGLKQV